MISKRFLYLSIGLITYWLLSVTLLHNNLDTPVRLFSDEFDRLVYFERGQWLPERLVPYKDVMSEYPQIPTYLFGLLHLPVIGETNMLVAYWKHSSIFSALMLIALAATIEILYKILPERKYLAYLLLLPAPLYYTFNRFDILPALFTLLSFIAFRDKKWNLSVILLAVGTLTKWYPALLLPVYLAYYYRTEKRIHWQMPAIFAVTCLTILLPTLMVGGVEALFTPYKLHSERGLESVALPTLVGQTLQDWVPNNNLQSYLILLFFILQIAAVAMAFISRIDTHKKLLYWSILIICGFITFARIFSPQWLLWILPFYILTIQSKTDIGIAVFYGISNYIAFPVVWDFFGDTSPELVFMGIVHVISLSAIAITTIRKIIHADAAPEATLSTP